MCIGGNVHSTSLNDRLSLGGFLNLWKFLHFQLKNSKQLAANGAKVNPKVQPPQKTSPFLKKSLATVKSVKMSAQTVTTPKTRNMTTTKR